MSAPSSGPAKLSWASMASKKTSAPSPSSSPKSTSQSSRESTQIAPTSSLPTAAAGNASKHSQTVPAPVTPSVSNAKSTNSWSQKLSTQTTAPQKIASSAQPKKPAQAGPKTPAAQPMLLASGPRFSQGWASLPFDILHHHIQPQLRKSSEIRCMRQVCFNWASSIHLPKVDIRAGNFDDSAALAARVCRELVLDTDTEESTKQVLHQIKSSRHLQSLEFHLTFAPSLDSIHALADVILHAPALKMLKIIDQMVDFSGVAHSRFPQRGESIYQHSQTILDRTSAIFQILIGSMEKSCLQTLENLELALRINSGNVTRLVAFVAQSEKLQTLSLRNIAWTESAIAQFSEILCTTRRIHSLLIDAGALQNEHASVLVSALETNASIESLEIINSSLSLQSIHKALVHNRTIRRLKIHHHLSVSCEAAVALFLELPRLKYFNVRSGIWDDDQKCVPTLRTLVEAPNFSAFANVSHLLSSPWRERDECMKIIATKGKLNRWAMSHYDRRRAFRDAQTFLSRCTSVQELDLGVIDPQELEQFPNLIKPLKSLKRITGDFGQMETTHRALTSALLKTIASLPNLVEIEFRGKIFDEGALALVSNLKSNKRIEIMDLKSSAIGRSGATALLDMIGKGSSVRVLDLTDANIDGTDPAFNKALEACLAPGGTLETLRLVGARVDPSTITTLINCLTNGLGNNVGLRLLDVTNVAMSAPIRQRFEQFVLRVSGLLKVVWKTRTNTQ